MKDRRRPSGFGFRGDSKIDELIDALGEDLSREEREYVERMKAYSSGKISVDNSEPAEVELRQREQETIRRDYAPTSPLYGSRQRQGEMCVKKSHPHKGKQPAKPEPPPQPKRSYQNDPRYKAFYDRLRQSNSSQVDYNEEVVPHTLDELEEQGWDGTLKAPVLQPQPSSQEVIKNIEMIRPSGAQDSDENAPGTIMLLDDGSIAVYKDSVSGKDYALFYFLEPDGSFAPRGIFLEQYEVQRIGQLPPEVFEEMRQSGRWEHDAVLFHLDKYQFAGHIRRLMARTPVPRETQYTKPVTIVERSRERERDERPITEERERPITKSDIHDDSEAEPERLRRRAPKRDILERGRVLRINVGGRIWESVCWTQDEISPIVAHDTNKEWALMHLDLTRFRDSIEYGELLSPERIAEIERNLAAHSS